jgi:hypothetical protein
VRDQQLRDEIIDEIAQLLDGFEAEMPLSRFTYCVGQRLRRFLEFLEHHPPCAPPTFATSFTLDQVLVPACERLFKQRYPTAAIELESGIDDFRLALSNYAGAARVRLVPPSLQEQVDQCEKDANANEACSTLNSERFLRNSMRDYRRRIKYNLTKPPRTLCAALTNGQWDTDFSELCYADVRCDVPRWIARFVRRNGHPVCDYQHARESSYRHSMRYRAMRTIYFFLVANHCHESLDDLIANIVALQTSRACTTSSRNQLLRNFLTQTAELRGGVVLRRLPSETVSTSEYESDVDYDSVCPYMEISESDVSTTEPDDDYLSVPDRKRPAALESVQQRQHQQQHHQKQKRPRGRPRKCASATPSIATTATTARTRSPTAFPLCLATALVHKTDTTTMLRLPAMCDVNIVLPFVCNALTDDGLKHIDAYLANLNEHNRLQSFDADDVLGVLVMREMHPDILDKTANLADRLVVCHVSIVDLRVVDRATIMSVDVIGVVLSEYGFCMYTRQRRSACTVADLNVLLRAMSTHEGQKLKATYEALARRVMQPSTP